MVKSQNYPCLFFLFPFSPILLFPPPLLLIHSSLELSSVPEPAGRPRILPPPGRASCPPRGRTGKPPRGAGRNHVFVAPSGCKGSRERISRGFNFGAAHETPVWEGFGRSHSWSRRWSPLKGPQHSHSLDRHHLNPSLITPPPSCTSTVARHHVPPSSPVSRLIPPLSCVAKADH
jgi:hypothetical protein